MTKIIVGLDESGTGAWAGPFTVCAVAFVENTNLQGVRDSKKMTDASRRAQMWLIAESALFGKCDTVSVVEYNQLGLARAWWFGATRALAAVAALLVTSRYDHTSVEVIIDGVPNSLAGEHIEQLPIIYQGKVRFEKKADDIYKEVGAASIVAKTVRNDEMNRLAENYPGYGWGKNSGYGTKDHRAAIDRLGITKHHRDVIPLKKWKT